MVDIYTLPSSVKIREQTFQLVKRTHVARTQGDFVQVKQTGWRYWKADFSLVPMYEADHGRFISFMEKVYAGRGYFRAFNTARPRPLAMDGGVPLSADIGLSAIFDARMSITLNNLPAGFVFTEGDMVELAQTQERLSLHQIGTDATADENGTVVLQLNSPVRSTITPDASVNLEKPSCLMQVFEPASHTRGLKVGTGSFTAQEVKL